MSYPNASRQNAPLSQAAFQPGQDQVSRILNSVRTGYIILEGTCTMTIGTANATAILNDGSMWALFTNLVFYENGVPVVKRDARAMARMTELLGFAPSSNVRAVSLAQAAYPLRDRIVIPFAWPLGINPWETNFMATDSNAPNTVGLTAHGTAWTAAGVATGNNVIVTPGASGTAAITLLNVNIVQEFDTDVAILPLYRPYMNDIPSPSIANAAAIADIPFYCDFPDVIRSLMIQQENSLGEASDIINAYQIVTDTSFIDGAGNDLVFADRVQQMVRWFGGAISAGRIARVASPFVNPAYLFRNFQSSGRLSNVLVRNQVGANFRLLLTAQQSATGTAGSSIVRAGLDRLQKVPGVTLDTNEMPNGQVVPY